ncbi:MAG: hypothetical protein AAGP08_13150 [Pseudomonadota bacterium]
MIRCISPGVALLLLSTALSAESLTPDAEVRILSTKETSAEIESNGTRYLCALAPSDVAITLTDCRPFLTEAQTDHLQAALADVARLTDALAAAEAAKAAGIDAARAASDAANADTIAALEAQIAALTAQVQDLDARLAPFLAADAEAAADAALRDQVAALQTSSGDLTRMLDHKVVALGLVGYKAAADSLGTPCALHFADVERIGEDALGRRVYTAVFAALEIPDDTAALMLSQRFDAFDDETSPMFKFRTAVNDTEDFDLHTRGREARTMLRDNLNAFDDRFEALVLGNPAVMAIDTDAGVATLQDCP